MHSILVVVASLVIAGTALAQYPARGQPEPSFNGGQPLVLPVTPGPDGLDQAQAVARLSGTRFAVVVVRAARLTDTVVIVDTIPDRTTTFELPLDPGAIFEWAYKIAAAGSAVVIGGFRGVATGSDATVEVREIGVGAIPKFDPVAAHASPGTAAYPLARTGGIAARLGAGNRIEIWQARNNFDANEACALNAIGRLDGQAGNLAERYAIDLSAALGRACLAIDTIALTGPGAGDPAGAQAMIAGGRCRDSSTAIEYLCAMRVLDTGSSLIVDRSYGVNGLAQYRDPDNVALTGPHLAVDANGAAWVAANRAPTEGTRRGIVVRFRPDGSFDPLLGVAGILQVPSGIRSWANDIAVTPDGLVLTAGRATDASGFVRPVLFYYDPQTGGSQLARLEIGDRNASQYFALVALPAGGVLAVGSVYTSNTTGPALVARLAGNRPTLDLLEYFHAGFGHYFLTGIADEIAKLDNGTFVGWQRTGESIPVLPTGAAGGADVCRFFSASFAPKSSHFYTPIASECDGLKNGNVWTYEGLVFALQTPSPAATCPVGTGPLFRLYNDGMSGAPNHRYSVREAVRAAQAALGWIGEGSGSPPVFACVPR